MDAGEGATGAESHGVEPGGAGAAGQGHVHGLRSRGAPRPQHEAIALAVQEGDARAVGREARELGQGRRVGVDVQRLVGTLALGLDPNRAQRLARGLVAAGHVPCDAAGGTVAPRRKTPAG